MTGQTTLLRYQGRSMWPCFQEGDLLEIVPIAIANIRIGDCVAFRVDSKQTIAHRVVTVQGSLITRGDALPTVDNETIQPKHFLGKVVYVYRLGRSIRIWGGIIGRIAGRFYRYAGRIDPHSTSRGGMLARKIHSLSTPCLRACRVTGEARTLKRTGTPDMAIWKFGGITVGRQDPLTHEWSATWPWNIILQRPDHFKNLTD